MIDLVGRSLADGAGMFWETLWALVLGFALSGAVQAFVSRARMQRALGDHRRRRSCAPARSVSCRRRAPTPRPRSRRRCSQRGADFTASQAFMFASTNLVLELGIVLWLLIGWEFAAAEFVGGVIMIALLSVVVPRVVSSREQRGARDGLDDGHADDHDARRDPHVRTSDRWRAGPMPPPTPSATSPCCAASSSSVSSSPASPTQRVPVHVWKSLFITGHGFWSALENVVLGPFLALISFVCSIGNVPLAAALWTGGITFGGTVAFVFGDLIALPLLLIYRKYYGTPAHAEAAGGVLGAACPPPGSRPSTCSALPGSRRSRTRAARGRPRRLGLELHDRARHRRARRLRRALPSLPQPRAPRRRVGVRQGPHLRHAGGEGAPRRRPDLDGEQVYFCSDHCRERYAASAPSGGSVHQVSAHQHLQLGRLADR